MPSSPGGAQGIGFAWRSRLRSSGASVTLWDRDGELLTAAVKELGGGDSVDAVIADVTDVASVAQRPRCQRRRFGKIDISGCQRRDFPARNLKPGNIRVDVWKQINSKWI